MSGPGDAMRPFVRHGITALVVLPLLAAFSGPVAAVPEGTLTWGVHVTLAARWLDPSDTEAFITPFMVLYAIHDALVKPMPAGDNTPSLAESSAASKDGLSYEFVLRKGVKFHNGDPVTAEDVKFSFDRYHGAAAKLLKDRVREVQIVDPGRVRFHLRGPWPDFMTFYGTSATGAAGIVRKRYVEKVGDEGRGRLAASHAFNRTALNQAETLGLSRPTGGLIPRVLEFARAYDPPAYAPARAKQLLAEAGYPSGFDAGDLTPFPPFFSLAEALGGYLQAVGIRTRVRTMERAAFLTAWREHKIKGVIMGLGAPAGNAATRVEVYVTRNGIYASGVVPEIEDLFQRQARELDRKKREAVLHQIQQIMHDRVLHVPIYELAFLWGVGPRVEEACVDWIKGFAYSAARRPRGRR